jgi:serine protease Do
VDTASRGSDERPRYTRRYSTDGRSEPREGSGSGFIIDPAGFILTNHHVVSGADRVTVTLGDGRSFRAAVVGVDPAIDVALLRVHAREPLPAAVLGDSNALRVGEWVCAIGNPLGVYVHSVTVGVISFLGRKLSLFDPSLEAFIQTDAAISFGNSGGPLVNARGQVVGITTAISSQAPNIGFAIPISEVVAVLGQLRERGSVVRGDIGIDVTTLTPALRRALRLGPEHGALVEDTGSDTATGAADLQPYDLIVAADGHAVASDEDLVRYIATRPPGALALLQVWRDAALRSVRVKLRDRPVASALARGAGRAVDVRPAAQDQAPLGLKVRDLDAGTADRLRIPDTIQGVLITDVDPAGPARLSQVRASQVIIEINRQRVTSAAGYLAIVSVLRPGEAAALLLYDHALAKRFITSVAPDSP